LSLLSGASLFQQRVRSINLWKPPNPLQISPLEAAAVQQQLSILDVSTLRSQLQLSLPDALAALLLAEGDLEGAHVQVACCAESGGPAKMWEVVFGASQVSTGCSQKCS
jgi:hypothetical protein